jgi:hypothetical protein
MTGKGRRRRAMRRGLTAMAAVCVMAMMSGCIGLSLYPIYTAKDLIFEEDLLGTWTGDEVHAMTFEKAGDKSYSVSVKEEEDGDLAKFEGHLIRIGDALFIDLYPDTEPGVDNGFYMLHLAPLHSFTRIAVEDDLLTMAFINFEWLAKELAKEDVALRHVTLDDIPILTAEAKDVQAFLQANVKNADAYGDSMELKRDAVVASEED